MNHIMKSPSYVFSIIAVFFFGCGSSTILAEPPNEDDPLLAEWQDVQRLPEGFPGGYRPELFDSTTGPGGTEYSFTRKPSEDLLLKIKSEWQNGTFKEVLSTGEDFLAEARRGMPVDEKYVAFMYGRVMQGVRFCYKMYCISEDPYYLRQIEIYTDAIQHVILTDPKQFMYHDMRDHPGVPKMTDEIKAYYDAERRKFLQDPKASIPTSLPHTAMFLGHALTAHSLLETAKEKGLSPDSREVSKAKECIEFAVAWLDSQVYGPYPKTIEPAIRKKDGTVYMRDPARPAAADETCDYITTKYGLPERITFSIVQRPWNQSEMAMPVFTALSKAIMLAGSFDSGFAEKYKAVGDVYRNTVVARMDILQKQADCVIKEGEPFIFRSYTTDYGRPVELYRGHPVKRGEDTGHLQAVPQALPIAWDIGGEDFGCTEALLAAYANAYYWNSTSSLVEDGTFPRHDVTSPWSIVANGWQNDGSSARRTLKGYVALVHYRPDLYTFWARKSARDNAEKVMEVKVGLLYSGYLLREAKRRRLTMGETDRQKENVK